MVEFEESIAYLRRVRSTQQFDKGELFCANKLIFHQAYKYGLDEESMKVVADVLKINSLPLAEYKELSQCMIPVTYVAESIVVDLALWILSNVSETSKITTAIQWLTGIIGNGLTKTDMLDHLYTHFFHLLIKTDIDSYLCPLLQVLTKPHLVARMHVLILNNQISEFGRKKQYDSLLSVIKHMQPHLVPEEVPVSYSNQYLMSNLSKSWRGLIMAKKRCSQEENNGFTDHINLPNYHEKANPSLIPQITYLECCQNHKQTLLEVDNWESLGACTVDLEMPSQSLSLLRCHFGLFSLAFGSHDLQRRFSSALQSTLCNVFLRNDSGMTYFQSNGIKKSENHLLQQLATLQEYLSQPIPVVSTFLAKYLTTWSGEEYQVSILRLLCYIHFSSFEELKGCILDPLYLLFISGDVEFKSSIINMFKELMKNMILKERWRNDKPSPFLGLKKTWSAEEIYPKLYEYISGLIETGLSSENGNSILLYTCLSFYHLIVSIQQVLETNFLMIPPPAVMYHSLFSHSPLCLSLGCSLLVRYQLEIFPVFASLVKVEQFPEEFGSLAGYTADYVKFLFSDEPFSNRSSSYIFQNLSDDTLKELSKVFSINSSSSLGRHIAFVPYYLSMIEKNLPVTDKAFYQIAEKKYPGIYNFACCFGPLKDQSV